MDRQQLAAHLKALCPLRMMRPAARREARIMRLLLILEHASAAGFPVTPTQESLIEGLADSLADSLTDECLAARHADILTNGLVVIMDDGDE